MYACRKNTNVHLTRNRVYKRGSESAIPKKIKTNNGKDLVLPKSICCKARKLVHRTKKDTLLVSGDEDGYTRETDAQAKKTDIPGVPSAGAADRKILGPSAEKTSPFLPLPSRVTYAGSYLRTTMSEATCKRPFLKRVQKHMSEQFLAGQSLEIPAIHLSNLCLGVAAIT